MGAKLGLGLRHDRAQQPRPDHQRSTEDLDRRRLHPVEQSRVLGCLSSPVPQPARPVLPPTRCRRPPPPVYDEAVARKNIGRKLQAYKRVDAAKRLKCNLRLRIKDVEALKEKQSNWCASCNIDLLWCYEPKDTRQFSVDRIDNAKGHTRDNVRLACLECNRKRRAAALTHCEATKNDGEPPGNVSAGQL